MFLLVHDYFVGGKFARAVHTMQCSSKLGSFCPSHLMHEFKPWAEFHATCCRDKIQQNIFAETGMPHEETVTATCPCFMSPKHSLVCASVCFFGKTCLIIGYAMLCTIITLSPYCFFFCGILITCRCDS